MLPLLLAVAVRAGGVDDPVAWRSALELRRAGAQVPLGVGDRSVAAWADRCARAGVACTALPSLERSVAEERPGWRHPRWSAAGGGRVAVGDAVPELAEGDAEPGAVTVRGLGELVAFAGVAELSLRPRLGLDAGGMDPAASLRWDDAWAGWRARCGPWGSCAGGAGLRGRRIGPGRRGSLLLSENARPAPHAAASWEGRVLGRRGLTLHLGGGAGWLDAPRDDVDRPGWLFMDHRWMPLPWVELGLSRLALFGGSGRPLPSLDQLLVPTDPHVYGDPDQELPDQDELAAFDLRVLLPVGRWSGRGSAADRPTGLDALEAWWQYGAEDVIRAEWRGVPYPSLAGVANLFGGEASAGPLVVGGEHARILDDYFRWYVGHRVYHDGFTQEGRVMGHPAGGDAVDGAAWVGWIGRERGLLASVGWRRRVGAVGAVGEAHLAALAVDETSRGVAVEAWRRRDDRRWWRLGLSLERVAGEDFVPGADGWRWRLAFEG